MGHNMLKRYCSPSTLLIFWIFFHTAAWADLSAPRNIRINGTVPTTKVIEQHGITWTFAEPVQYGQFINGDYWVADPGDGVKIVQIDPAYTSHPDTGRHMNGSMLNPSTATQGYDGYQMYDAALNVAIGISSVTPLVLTGDQSLVSTISNMAPGINHLSYVKTAAVLTCLRSIPPAGSFRPGISTTTKSIHNVSSLDFSLLAKLACPITKPDINKYAEYFQMVWLDHNGGWTVRYMHPSDSSLDNYYFPIVFSEAALMLHVDYPDNEKERLLYNFIQLGIDLYSYLESGADGWQPNGGHSNGRKWPILFAGLVLNDPVMKNIGQASGDYLHSGDYRPGDPPPDYKHFAEDGQTFYVAQSDIDITHGVTWSPDSRTAPNYPYTSAMHGMPEWGIRHSTEPQKSDASWNASYRKVGSGVQSWAGTALAAMIMDTKSLWNHNAHFDYVDRYMAISNGKPDPFGYSVPNESAGSRPGGLIGAMWDTYRVHY